MALTEKDLHLLEPLMLKRLMLELPLGLQLLLKGAEQMEDLFVEERMRAEFRETDVKLVRLFETAIVAVSLQLSWSFLFIFVFVWANPLLCLLDSPSFLAFSCLGF